MGGEMGNSASKRISAVSAALCVIGISAAVAAQQAPEISDQGSGKDSGPQQSPTPAQAAPQTDTTGATPSSASKERVLQEVEVVGVRWSLKQAQDIKRYAPSVVEAITPTDIGRFSDSSIADALGRVPGVQLDRGDGKDDPDDSVAGGDRISIRGLGSSYVQATYNGREMLSYSGRAFNYDVVPSEILSGVMIYKSPTPDLVESGLAGSVDFRSLRALDYHSKNNESTFGGLNLEGSYDGLRRERGRRISGIFGQKLFGDTLGYDVAFVASHEKEREDRVYTYAYPCCSDIPIQGTTIDYPANTRRTNQVEYQGNLRDPLRTTITGGLQWRPNSQVEINLDGGYNKYIYAGSSLGGDINVDGYGTYQNVPASAIAVLPPADGNGAPVVRYIDTSQIPSIQNAGLVYGYSSNTFVHNGEYNTFGGFNGKWTNDIVTISADYAYGDDYAITIYRILGCCGVNTSTIYDDRGSGLPIIIPTPGLGNTANFQPGTPGVGDFHQESQYKSHRHQARLDGDLKLNDSVTLKAGVRYETTTYDVRNANNYNGPYPSAFASAVPLNVVNILGQQFFNIDYNAYCRVVPQDCALTNADKGSFAGGNLPPSINVTTDPIPQLYGFFQLLEKKYALYTSADFDGTLRGLPFSGNAGVRAVKTTETGTGYTSVQIVDSIITVGNPVTVSTLTNDAHSFTEYLPSFNLKVSPLHNLNVRFGAARTMSFPEYSDLAPNNSAQIYRDGAPGTVSGGNTRLNPLTAWSFDLTTEYYTRNGGAIIFSLFDKEIKNFIGQNQYFGTAPTIGEVPAASPYVNANTKYNITGPLNIQNGNAHGLELGANQPFTFLPSPWDGFGAQANFTLIDTSFSVVPVGFARTFPGASKYNANGILYYEKYGFGARVATTYRSPYVTLNTSNGPIEAEAETQLDASLSYRFDDHVEIFLQGTNLNGQNRLVRYADGAFKSFTLRPTTYYLTLRLSL